MDRSFRALAHATVMVVVAIGAPLGQGGASLVVAAEQSAPAPSTVSANGVTLRSVSVDNPDSAEGTASVQSAAKDAQIAEELERDVPLAVPLHRVAI